MQNKLNNKTYSTQKPIQDQSYSFVLSLIKLIDTLNKKDFATAIIARQVLRSGTSIGANVIEAQAGRTTRNFSNFLNHALKSANETCFWLSTLKDSGKGTQNVSAILNECTEITRILGSSMVTLKRKGF